MGGFVCVYSVCSFEPEETIDVVTHFISLHGEFVVDDLSPFTSKYNLIFDDKYIIILPDQDDLDGFFIARFNKTI